MFNKEEIYLLKELVEIEIAEVNRMLKISNDIDKLTLLAHRQKLRVILEKLNNF